MSLRRFFGLAPATDTMEGDTETVRRIVRELESMDPARARQLASFAYLLSRVAGADSEVTEAEDQRMEQLIFDYGELTRAQAVLALQIAKSQAHLFGATENFLVSRQFREHSTHAEREKLLHCLFAVSAADDSISSVEETEIRQIAGELEISDREFLEIRSSYNHKRAVLKNLPGPG